MKSLRARIYAWAKGQGITAVLAGRISYALNAAQEWREGAPGAAEQEAAARDALADYDELTEAERRAAERFGPEAPAPARVWCYLTHDKMQLEALFRTGHGVCIVSPNFCAVFLQWIRDMGSSIRVEQLYVEEVTGLAQMWNTKVLRSVPTMEALRSIATRHSRRVFGFCADFLVPGDDRPSIFMNWCVDDRQHYVFKVPNARPHMQREVCIFHGADTEESAAFDVLYDQLLACMIRHPDFLVWHSISYEKLCIKMYTTAVQLGIRSMLLIGNADGEDKLRFLTNFDHECRDVQALFATSVVRDGINSKRKWSAVVVITGPQASGPLTHGQAAGRGGRMEPGLEFNTILWKLCDTNPPAADERLTSLREAEKRHHAREHEKERHAQRNRVKVQSTPKLLVDLAVRNEKEKVDVRSHCALLTGKLIEYKPGWTRVDHTNISLPQRISTMTPPVVEQTFAAARPLPDSMIQKLDSASDEVKMKVGLSQLLACAEAKYVSGEVGSYQAAEQEVLETCDGLFEHSHVASTYQHGKRPDAKLVQMIRAWKVVRHFTSLSTWKPAQLLVVEKYEDELNLAACHLTLGVRRLLLARQLLSAMAPNTGVGMYTRLPERVGALEQACKIIGVSNLSTHRMVLTVEHHPFVRLLQADKMGEPSVDVDAKLKELRVLIDVAVASDRSPTHGTKTLWDTLRSLLGCVCSVVKVIKDRRMTVDERKAWEEHNDCTSSALAMATQVPGMRTAEELDALFGFSDEEEPHPTAAMQAPAKPKAKKKKEGGSLRLPVEIEIRRRPFYFQPDGTPVNADKANSTSIEVDFVPMWRVYSHVHGESKAARNLLGSNAPESVVDRELESLLPSPPDERVEVTNKERDAYLTATTTAKTHDTVTRLVPKLKDGAVMVEEPIPAEAFRRALMRLRAKKKAVGNRLCTPQLLDAHRNAKSKGDKQRLEREHEQRIRRSLGPSDTSRLQWCEALERKASQTPDEHGLRWNLVKYRVKYGVGREVASWPSIQACERRLREEIFSSIMHDWDIVSCHFFLSEAVVVGLLKLDPEATIPTIWKYNRACEEDLRTGRGKEGNTFLKPIAEWYDVTVSEAKMGCHILHNQGTVQTWLQKELDPPKDVPDHHPVDVTNLMGEAVTLRRLFIQHADKLFGREAFEALKAKLLVERPDDGNLKSRDGMERSIFGYCMQHLEKTATAIAMKASTEFGQPPITRIYDGFGQLHVDGKDPAAFKVAAEAALHDHFKSPIYLTEKPFYKADVVDLEDTATAQETVGDEDTLNSQETAAAVDHAAGADTKAETSGEVNDDDEAGEEAGEESGEESSDDDDSMEASGEESDNGDGLPDDGREIDPFEACSEEEEEPDSGDQDFIASSEEEHEGTSSSNEGDATSEAHSEPEAGASPPNVARKRNRRVIMSDDEENGA